MVIENAISLFGNFDFPSLRMTFAKSLSGTESSNLRVKFCFRVAFHNWYFQHYHYFRLSLITSTLTKFW